MITVGQWDWCDVELAGPAGGNPFVDVDIAARFSLDVGDGGRDHHLSVPGFYDGDGTYRIRFMPTRPGTWRYRTTSNVPDTTAPTGADGRIRTGIVAVAPAATTSG